MGNLKIKTYNKILKKHQKNGDLVQFERNVTDGEANISGFILQMSKDFILIQNVVDFRLDGYTIIRQDHYDRIRCNDYDRTYKKILGKEGILPQTFEIKNSININTWNSLFSDLRKKDFHVVVECEDLKKPTFIIGPVIKIGKKSAQIRYYDAEGVLEERPTKVKFKNITKIEFGDRYSTIFRKYLKQPKSIKK